MLPADWHRHCVWRQDPRSRWKLASGIWPLQSPTGGQRGEETRWRRLEAGTPTGCVSPATKWWLGVCTLGAGWRSAWSAQTSRLPCFPWSHILAACNQWVDEVNLMQQHRLVELMSDIRSKLISTNCLLNPAHIDKMVVWSKRRVVMSFLRVLTQA